MNKIYSGVHWAKRKKQKDKLKLIVRASLGNDKPRFTKPVCLAMRFNSNLDVSNHAYLFKMIEDALVSNKVLINDSPKYVKEIKMSRQSEYKGVIVIIREIDG